MTRLRSPVFLLCITAALAVAAAGCGGRGAEAPSGSAQGDLLSRPWEEIEAAARGQEVTLVMWMGDPYINAYINGFVAPALAERHGVRLNVVSGQGSTVVSMLMTEIEAGREVSSVDLAWINGETFYQLRQIDALFGPFVDKLPGSRYLDLENPFIRYDFQQEIQGYECPWGNVQLALIYDQARISDPPRDRRALAEWVRAHPGRFTFDAAFTGMTFLKSLLADFAGGPKALDGPFDEAKYARASAELWDYLNGIKRHFWQRGETFPGSVAQLHQLFANGEVDFTMSNNDGEVDNKVLQGLFPDTARAYVLDTGTIQNSHYIGVAKRALHLAAALVTVDFLISPEAQYEKAKPQVWGDGTVLDVGRLPPPWPDRFANVPERTHAPDRREISRHAIQEPDPQYMIRLYEDFRTHVVEK